MRCPNRGRINAPLSDASSTMSVRWRERSIDQGLGTKDEGPRTKRLHNFAVKTAHFGFQLVVLRPWSLVLRPLMSWIEQPIFFVDFEGSAVSGVLEYGVVALRGAQITEAHTRL